MNLYKIQFLICHFCLDTDEAELLEQIIKCSKSSEAFDGSLASRLNGYICYVF